MSVFRAPKNQQPQDEDWNENDSNFYERQKLNQENQRFDDDPLTYQPSEESTPEEKQLLDSDQAEDQSALTPTSSDLDSLSENSQASKPSLANRLGLTSGKGMSSRAKKQALMAVGTFLMPTLLGLLLFMIALQSGFVLEHIRRITTGIRFGAYHYQLSKRVRHIQVEYIQTRGYIDANNADTINKSKISPYARGTLGSRLLSVDPRSLMDQLRSRGSSGTRFEFEYGRFGKGKNIWTQGKDSLTKIQVINSSGKVVEEFAPKNFTEFSASLDNLEGHFSDTFGDTEIGRYRTLRAQLLLAGQSRLPFARFKTIIKSLKDGSLKNAVRGSPGALKQAVTEKVNESILKTKKRITKATGLRDSIKNLGGEEALDDTEKQATKGGTNANVKITGFVRGASVIALLATVGCTIRELGLALKGAFAAKNRGLQDSAATIETLASQSRAGDMSPEIIGDMSSRFNGFNTSANYQAGVSSPDLNQYIGSSQSDFSTEFSSATTFDGVASKQIFDLSNLFSDESIARVAELVLSGVTFGAYSVFKSLAGLFGFDTKQKIIDWIKHALNKFCQFALSLTGQLIFAASEIVVTIAATIATAGGWGAATTALSQILRQMLSLKSIAFALGGISLDRAVQSHVLEPMVKSANGIDTTISYDPDNPQNGARNYALVDYGMHQLKEQEALNLGGSRIPVASALAQTQTYLAQQKQYYINKGIWHNIASKDNPYSIASKLLIDQHGQEGVKNKSQSLIAGLFKDLPQNLSFSTPVRAQVNSQAMTNLLYPGQTYVVGFYDEAIDSNGNFNHVNNTVYVENNLSQLKADYSECLGIDSSDYLLAQQGIHPESYPAKCDDTEARRYKMYFTDCQMVESLVLWQTTSSPMYSSQCDSLLPEKVQDEHLSDSQANSEQTVAQKEVSDLLWNQIQANQNSIITQASTVKTPTSKTVSLWFMNLGF